MKQLEGREMSCKQKLRETIIKRNEHFKKMNSVVKELDQDGSNSDLKQHVTMLQLQVGLNMVYFGYKLYFSFKYRLEMVVGLNLEESESIILKCILGTQVMRI